MPHREHSYLFSSGAQFDVYSQRTSWHPAACRVLGACSQTEGATAALLGSWSYSGTFSYSVLPENLPLHPVHTGYNPNPGKRWVGVRLMTPKYAGEMVQW